VGGVEPAGGDVVAQAEAPPLPDAPAAAEPIDPKTDPRGIGSGEKDEFVSGEGEEEGEKLRYNPNMGPLEERPLADARLHYGPDSKLLAKSPADPYTIHAKSATVSLSFTMDLTGDPALVDASWFLLKSDMSPRPQLRAVYVPPGLHQHVLYSDAEWTADPGATVVYTFKNLTVAEGGELRFFVKEATTADFHVGDFVALDSNDASKPFPSEPTAAFFPAGSFAVKAVLFLSPTQGPTLQQNTAPSQPIFKR
jgi:hypothetical protein